MHYITLANYGITGWASVAMPILPSASLKSICSRQATPLAHITATDTKQKKQPKIDGLSWATWIRTALSRRADTAKKIAQAASRAINRYNIGSTNRK